jgi:hypothetical protein
LATSRISSNNPDWVDVVEVMAAFEEINRVTITLTGRVVVVAGARSLRLELQAHDNKIEIGEAPSLASQRCSLGYGGYKTMESAIMWALYQLDWQLAQHELDKTKLSE